MKILYLTYDGLTDQLGQSQVIPYLRGWRKMGHEITIMSSEKKAKPELIASIGKMLKEEGITWKNIPYTKSPPVLSTVFDIFRMMRYCNRLMKESSFDIVHCRSYVPSLIGEYLKRKSGLKFIFDMRGFYADERIDGDIWDQNKLVYRIIYRYFKKKEARFLSCADYTICLTESARKEIASWRSIANQPIPIEVIPCCVDTDYFHPEKVKNEERIEAAEKLGIHKDDLVLSYLGAVGTWYMLDEMLDFYKQLSLKYTNSKFLFITHESPDLIHKHARLKQIPDDKLIIYKADHDEVPTYLSLSHLSIFFIKPVYSKKGSSPAKMGEILSMGIPILCNSEVGDTTEIIGSTKTGAVLKSFTPADYDYLIDQIPRLLATPKTQIREAALQYFSLEKGVEKYNKVHKLAQTSNRSC
ncbi:MAG: glycosyltransferase [Bacteroidia bacterium]